MRCRQCGKVLGYFAGLRKREFCCVEHRSVYYLQKTLGQIRDTGRMSVRLQGYSGLKPVASVPAGPPPEAGRPISKVSILPGRMCFPHIRNDVAASRVALGGSLADLLAIDVVPRFRMADGICSMRALSAGCYAKGALGFRLSPAAAPGQCGPLTGNDIPRKRLGLVYGGTPARLPWSALVSPSRASLTPAKGISPSAVQSPAQPEISPRTNPAHATFDACAEPIRFAPPVAALVNSRLLAPSSRTPSVRSALEWEIAATQPCFPRLAATHRSSRRLQACSIENTVPPMPPAAALTICDWRMPTRCVLPDATLAIPGFAPLHAEFFERQLVSWRVAATIRSSPRWKSAMRPNVPKMPVLSIDLRLRAGSIPAGPPAIAQAYAAKNSAYEKVVAPPAGNEPVLIARFDPPRLGENMFRLAGHGWEHGFPLAGREGAALTPIAPLYGVPVSDPLPFKRLSAERSRSNSAQCKVTVIPAPGRSKATGVPRRNNSPAAPPAPEKPPMMRIMPPLSATPKLQNLPASAVLWPVPGDFRRCGADGGATGNTAHGRTA